MMYECDYVCMLVAVTAKSFVISFGKVVVGGDAKYVNGGAI